ncbi:helix-turn-helix domain-containing protein [Alkalibacillus aidingensis]|uniref:helix-turn-helix domain-containing protein n=1 Tax=Alkalibacillus aidingensis TaxID=2747607 RepID=UPI0016605D57|nr:helix-turn-helix transcriptional regulator [Alkalibacillus aidingensis]
MTLVGKTIKWYRTGKGLTQEQLAEGICSVTYISKLENGLVEFNEDILRKLSQRLDIKQSLILSRKNPSLEEDLKGWLEHIHIFHIPEMKKFYNKLTSSITDDLHVDHHTLYYLGLFGHYLLMDQLNEAEKIFKYITNRSMVFKACAPYSFYKFVGIYYRRKGLYNHAIEHLETAEEILGDEEDPELHLVMAQVYNRFNDILISNKHAQKAFKLFQDKLYYVRMIDCQVVLGVNYCLVGDYYSAENYFVKLKEVDGEHLLDKTRANIHHHIGYIRFHMQRYDEAQKYFKKALDFNISESDFLNARYLLSYIHVLKKDHYLAKKHINHGLMIAKNINHQRYIVKFKVLKMQLEKRDGELLDYLQHKVLPFFENSGEEVELKHYYYLYGQLLYQNKRYKKAAEYFMLARDHYMV